MYYSQLKKFSAVWTQQAFGTPTPALSSHLQIKFFGYVSTNSNGLILTPFLQTYPELNEILSAENRQRGGCTIIEGKRQAISIFSEDEIWPSTYSTVTATASTGAGAGKPRPKPRPPRPPPYKAPNGPAVTSSKDGQVANATTTNGAQTTSPLILPDLLGRI